MTESHHWGFFSFNLEGLLKTEEERADGEKDTQERDFALLLSHECRNSKY